MRKFNWQILLLALWPYAGVLLLEVLWQSASWTFAPVLAWMTGLLIVCVVNIVHAFRVQDRAVLPGMLFAAPPAVIILFLLNGLLLLATSAYTLRGAYLGLRAGALSTLWGGASWRSASAFSCST